MIARIWRGVTPESKAKQYFGYLMETGIKDYRSIEGNRGVYILQRIHAGQAEFLLISLWESFEAIHKFAGEDIERAVYYPEDKDYLIELEPTVKHYEILSSP